VRVTAPRTAVTMATVKVERMVIGLAPFLWPGKISGLGFRWLGA
jgi:hypothetical protein